MTPTPGPRESDLEHFPVLAGLAPELKRETLSRARLVSISRGELLFRQGDPARRIYLCRVGQLKLYRLSPSGQEKIVAIVHPGRSFAEATMFMPARRYPVHCGALKASQLIAFDADYLVELLSDDPSACFRLMGTLSARLQDKISQIESLAFENAYLRVAHYLYNEFRRHGRSREFDLESGKKHIAGYLAIQPETISRAFSQLQNDGILAVEARRITVLEPERLEQVACGTDPLPAQPGAGSMCAGGSCASARRDPASR